MPRLFSAKLKKLNIKSYSKVSRSQKDLKDQFDVMFNPESYSLNYANTYASEQAYNTSGKEARYLHSNTRELSIKIVLDARGIDELGISGLTGEPQSIYHSVQQFLELTYEMDGEIHEPRYLTLSWGSLEFKCRLTSVRVNYSLFNRSGDPLRAELDTTFISDQEDSERIKEEGKSSPDLTHVRIVKAHHQLPQMCEDIYGSPHYYLAVARANGILHFRNLTPGQEIFFPPFEK